MNTSPQYISKIGCIQTKTTQYNYIFITLKPLTMKHKGKTLFIYVSKITLN